MMLCSMIQSNDEIQTFIFMICLALRFVQTAKLDKSVDSDETKMQLLITKGGVWGLHVSLCMLCVRVRELCKQIFP